MRRLVQVATLTAACCFALLIGSSALAGASVVKGSGPLTTATAFNGAYMGTTGTWTSLFAPSLSVSPAELGPGGTATFTTTISATANAAEWTCAPSTLCHPELIVAGFGHGKGNSRLEGDGSLLYGQDNSMGYGYCANDKFYTGSTFIFGTGDKCYTHAVPLGSTETYSVTITGTNTFTDTVTSSTGKLSATFTGTLSSSLTTSYTPAIYLLPGRTVADQGNAWTFTVGGTTLSVS